MIGIEQPRSVAVTGISGFLGFHLAERLVHEGMRVVGLDRVPPAHDPTAMRGQEVPMPGTGLVFERCDLSTDDLAPILRGMDTVFHLAGMSGVRESWGNRFSDYVHANVLGTQRLLEACRTAGVQRVVIASSSSVYGSATGRPSLTDDLPHPVSPYGVSKLAAERLALAYAERPAAGFDVCILRYFTVYGPRQRPTMLMARVLEAAYTRCPLMVFGDGSQRRHFTYVDDAVEATVLAGTRPLTDSCVVNVAGPHSISVSDVLTVAESVVGNPVPVRYEADRPGDVSASEADLGAASTLLGYRPRVDPVEGITAHWEWYRAAAARTVRSAARVAVPGGIR
ncbi:NAD-dependent epimerase/dehydratase family protein [Thermobifida halotolerans]|uniref:NAD-dependent epimerase/dehydratase family protein n=2 Tax=Thermobifida halotolerans TaxID=483545 RepID=A0A399FXU5_9ACTN|nr:NAD-dependent epimerase/dehydratase family protein [Thermobifida halotolerans]